ncbi:hypothetical protein EJB05_31150, partial [Eragrostis curvula]
MDRGGDTEAAAVMHTEQGLWVAMGLGNMVAAVAMDVPARRAAAAADKQGMMAEAVVVEEDGVERPVEEGGRHRALEVVEAEVEEAKRWQVEDQVGERADEAVVAEVELVEEAEAAERRREDAAEAVGVEVEQREVREEAQLRREEPRNIAVVEVHAGNGHRAGVRRQRPAVHAGVVADVRAHPVGGEVVGVGEDGLDLPRLQRDVRVPQPPARELPRRVHLHRRRPPLAAVELIHRRRRADGGGDKERHKDGSFHLISGAAAISRRGAVTRSCTCVQRREREGEGSEEREERGEEETAINTRRGAAVPKARRRRQVNRGVASGEWRVRATAYT